MWQTGEIRGFAQSQIAGILPKVLMRRCLDAVGVTPVEDLVQIPVHDLVVVVLTLQLKRDNGLLELAVDFAGDAGVVPCRLGDVDILDACLLKR